MYINYLFELLGCVVALGEAWGNSSKLVFTNHTDMWLYVALGAVLVYVFLMCYFNKAHRNLIPGHMPVVCGFIPFLGVAISVRTMLNFLTTKVRPRSTHIRSFTTKETWNYISSLFDGSNDNHGNQPTRHTESVHYDQKF
jgi:hypothetical protein